MPIGDTENNMHAPAPPFAGHPRSSLAGMAKLSWLIIPAAICLLYVAKPILGVVVGTFAAIFLALKHPTLALPLFFFAVMIRTPKTTLFPIQDGWVIILGFLVGLSMHMFLRINIPLSRYYSIILFSAWSFIILVIAVLYYDAHLIRHSSVVVMSFLAFLLISLISQGKFHRKGFHFTEKEILYLSAFLVGAALIIALTTIGLVHGGDISLRVAEVSPRSLSIPLGALLVAGVLRHLLCFSKNLSNFWFIILGFLSFGGLLLTGSRIAIIAVIVSVVIVSGGYILIKTMKGRLTSNILIKLFFALLFIAGVILTINAFIPLAELRSFRELAIAENSRRLMWRNIIDYMNIKNLLIGVGMGNEHTILGTHPHSLFFSVLFYFGILGLFLLCFIFIRLFQQAYKQRNVPAIGVILYILIVFSTSGHLDRPEFWSTLIVASGLIGLEGYRVSGSLRR